jgi:AraC family transcriptional regulator
MFSRPEPEFRTQDQEITLTGTMSIYASQDEASEGIPRQWQSFLQMHPELSTTAQLYGASPCTGDGKIHYLAGTTSVLSDNAERLTLAPGEYAVVRVDDPASLRDTWVWLLTDWLRTSGRKERHAPEFERYGAIAEDGTPRGHVEIWIPLESFAS